LLAGTGTQAPGSRRLSVDFEPVVTLDLALTRAGLAESAREVDTALLQAGMRPDLPIIVSMLLAETGTAMPRERDPRGIRLEVAEPEQGLAALSAPARTPGWPPSSPRVRLLLDHLAARWGTVHENGDAVLWLQLPPVGAGTNAAQASALARAMTQLGSARTYGEVATVLAEVVGPRIDAAWTSLGVCAPDGVRIVAPEGTGTADTALPLDAPLPVTAVARTGRPLVHTSQAVVAAEFPRLHARMVGARLQALAHLPGTNAGRTAAVLCFGWTDAGQVARQRWLLTVLADLVAEAVTRIRTQDEAAQRTNQGEHARLLRSGRVELDLAARTVRITGRPAPVVLTGREFAVMLQLLRSAGTPQPRAALLAQVWGPARTDTSVVDVTMSRLRRKLELPELITVKDVGYVFDPARGATGATA
jgi:hypothetical protein